MDEWNKFKTTLSWKKVICAKKNLIEKSWPYTVIKNFQRVTFMLFAISFCKIVLTEIYMLFKILVNIGE